VGAGDWIGLLAGFARKEKLKKTLANATIPVNISVGGPSVPIVTTTSKLIPYINHPAITCHHGSGT
jgi:hypothetical protein